MKKSNSISIKKFHIYAMVVMILSLFVFSSTLEGALNNDWLIPFNHLIADFVYLIRSPWLTATITVVTNFASASYILFWTLILGIYLLYKKRYYTLCLTLFSLILGATLQYILKAIINLPRPDLPLAATILSSFPSGHTTLAVIFGACLFFSFVQLIKSRWGRSLFLILIIFGVLLIGFSRIYLNVHWTTDVLAGISLGLFCVTFSILFFRVGVFVKRRL